MAALARFKGLRGTAFDPFGYSHERKQERHLINWYMEILDDCAANFARENAAAWSEILKEPMEIRGFGPIKASAAEAAIAKVVELRSSIPQAST